MPLYPPIFKRDERMRVEIRGQSVALRNKHNESRSQPSKSSTSSIRGSSSMILIGGNSYTNGQNQTQTIQNGLTRVK
ncbi:hypothetical protein QJS10_CPB17g02187 [Acorus calamus]|uniref:Uncharacterized protein n=1 Tax=Acorus calamus TaxID=4465 RepID=A0AAV9CU41_ACOCL|nr:hypothetical protein QJS10_CPB17g02187 [Acorus calamus]